MKGVVLGGVDGGLYALRSRRLRDSCYETR